MPPVSSRVGSLSRNRASGIPPENIALEVILVMSRRSKFEVIADILRFGWAPILAFTIGVLVNVPLGYFLSTDIFGSYWAAVK